jgi:hypothetical protein
MSKSTEIADALLGGMRRLAGMNATLIEPNLCFAAADEIERLETLIEKSGGPAKSVGADWDVCPQNVGWVERAAYMRKMTIADQIRYAPRPLFHGAENFRGGGHKGIFGVNPDTCKLAATEIYRLVAQVHE